MTTAVRPGWRRRWDRWLLQAQGRLDGSGADRALPWISSTVVFLVMLSTNAAAVRTLNGGSGLAPWLQAAWARHHPGVADPVGGADPAHQSWSLISEPVLWLSALVPPEGLFATVHAAAIALTVVPLWRLARQEAHLRVGASLAVLVAFALAPTLHRANLTAFHPELIALPALVWAYLLARREHWRRFAATVVVVLLCRADLGLTVMALGLLMVSEGRRRPGLTTAAVGLAWSAAAAVALSPEPPDAALTPAGEFVARATTPIAVLRQIFLDPLGELSELLAEPSVLFLVVVFSPLLFLPLVSTRRVLVAVPGLVLAMVADARVQQVAQQGVLDLAPAAAHIGPAIAFVFIALVFALERIGERSVTRVNVDRRVLITLLIGVVLLFVTEAPTSPYREPWAWGSRDAHDGALMAAADLVGPDASVAASPSATALVAARADLQELPPDPSDLDVERVDALAVSADAVLLDTSGTDPVTGEPVWTEGRRDLTVLRLENRGFEVAYAAEGVYLLVVAPEG